MLVEAKPKFYIRKPKIKWRVPFYTIVESPWVHKEFKF